MTESYTPSLYRPKEEKGPPTLADQFKPTICVLCRRPNPNPASSACPTCVPLDEGEMRLQGTVAALHAEIDGYKTLLRKAMVELVVIDPRSNPPRDRLVDEIEAALGEKWDQARDSLSTR